MRGNERLQGCRAHEGSIARQHNRKLRSAKRAFGTIHGAAGAILRLLQHGKCPERLDHCGDLFRLVTHDDHGLAGLQRLAGAHNMFDERSPARAVQHLRQARLQPRPFARSQDHNS